MTNVEFRVEAWTRFQVVQEQERQRLAFLRQPTAKNPDHLTRLVKIRRIHPTRGFWANRKVVALGEIATVEAWAAADLVALKKAEYVP